MHLMAAGPPMPLNGKFFVALLMLLMVGTLIRLILKRPLSGWSIVAAIAVTLLVVACAEATLPITFGPNFHNLGMLAAVLGGLVGVLLLMPLGKATSKGRLLPALWTSLKVFICGPLLGAGIALVSIAVAGIPPLDRGYILASCTAVGVVAGIVVALVIAVLLIIHPARPIDSGTE